MPRVAVLISHAHQEPFVSILNGFDRPSKFNFENFSFDIFYFEGRRGGEVGNFFRTKIEKIRYSPAWPLLRAYDTAILWLTSMKLPIAKSFKDELGREFLRINTPEDQRHIAIKVYSALAFCDKKDYDFILRTTSNSIFNVKNLVDFLNGKINTELLYAGREVKSLNRPSFISGSFLILNRRALQYLLNSRFSHNYGVLDDVAIGRLFNKSKPEVNKEFCGSMDFPNLSLVADQPKEVFLKATHYRCKSTTIPRNDLEIMLELANQLTDGEISYF